MLLYLAPLWVAPLATLLGHVAHGETVTWTSAAALALICAGNPLAIESPRESPGRLR